jgi:hypothetical protein
MKYPWCCQAAKSETLQCRMPSRGARSQGTLWGHDRWYQRSLVFFHHSYSQNSCGGAHLLRRLFVAKLVW